MMATLLWACLLVFVGILTIPSANAFRLGHARRLPGLPSRRLLAISSIGPAGPAGATKATGMTKLDLLIKGMMAKKLSEPAPSKPHQAHAKPAATPQPPQAQAQGQARTPAQPQAQLNRVDWSPRYRVRDLPWWMTEPHHPRILPVYRPWWVQPCPTVTKSWSHEALQKEAKRRGVVATGSKEDLVERLNDLKRRYSLEEEGNWTSASLLSPLIPQHMCYPEHYEDGTLLGK